MKNFPQADFILNNNTGGTVTLVEVKSYPRLSNKLQEQTFNQLESYAKILTDPKPLRYYTILSTATGYVRDIKTNKELEFDIKPILYEYLNEKKEYISPRLLSTVYEVWLRDLSSGTRKKLTDPEKKLQDFGFIQNIRDTVPQTEVAS